MRCSLCQALNPPLRTLCVLCGAHLVESKHREVVGVSYLLQEVGAWERQQRYTPAILDGLKGEYEARREGLRAELRPPPVVVAALPPPPAPGPAPVTALRVAPMARSRPVPPPPPPKPPFSWKNLYTERNIRWVLNLGIFIFSVALAVFIRTQWREMSPHLRAGILFGASFAAIGAGHFLRRTILKATGTALVLLGAIAVPIDFAALVEFGFVGSAHAHHVGLCGAVFSLTLYAALARLYAEARFLQLATLAAMAAWGFFLRGRGVAWEAIVPWTAPVALTGVIFGLRPIRWVSTGVLAGGGVLTLAFLGGGLLSVHRDLVPLEVAFGSIIPAMLWAEGKTGRRGFRWGTTSAVVALYLVAAAHEGRTLGDLWLSLALVGSVCGLGWWKKHLPMVSAGILASVLSCVAAVGHWDRLTLVLAVPAALHLAYGLLWNDERHASVGGGLAGAALLAGMQAARIPDLWQPLGLAACGVLAIAVSRRRTPQTLQVLGTLAAGSAMLLLAAWYSRYYLPKPFPGVEAPSGGQGCQLLGSAIALTAALAFGPLANAGKSRFLSDITYGCIGFSYILALRWAHVPGKWLGLAVAVFGLAYAVMEKRVSKWLLRPSFFTGIACTVAAGVLAFLQWFVHHEYLQSALTLLLIGGFYLAAAARTPWKALAHPGAYLLTAGWLVALQGLGVYPEARALLTLVPAGLGLIVAGDRRNLHLGLASLVVVTGALSFEFLDPAMYSALRLPYLIASSIASAAVAGWFAFSRRSPREIDDRAMSALMAAFSSSAYLLWLKSMSTGSPWGGLIVFAMTAALCGVAVVLRRGGFPRQALPIAWVSFATTALSVGLAHLHGFDEGVHRWVYGAAFVLNVAVSRELGREEFGWAGVVAGAAGLLFSLAQLDAVPWLGIALAPGAALALQRRDRPLRALGFLVLGVCPAHTLLQFQGSPAAAMILVVEAAALSATSLRPASLYPMILGLALSWSDPRWGMTVSFSGFALYLALALLGRHQAYLHAALGFALLGDYLLATRFPSHEGLAAFPLALLLLVMAYQLGRRFGREFGWPLMGAGILAAGLSTLLAIPIEGDRILVLLADAILFSVAAVVFRRPALMYLASASLVGLAVAFMGRYEMPRIQMGFYLLALALTKLIFVRTCGQRLGAYLRPVYVAALLTASAVLLFGLCDHRRALRPESLQWSIWGLILVSAVFGVAGRIRRIPIFVYLAAANLLGAYYLALHKYDASLWEAYTLPVALGAGLWSALVLRENRRRVAAEIASAAVCCLPSMLQSFDRDRSIHALYALALAFGLVLAGMVMKRRAYLLGGSIAFVLEVLGKALQFLIDQNLSAAGWGMLIGGVMIVVAALFESRKAKAVRERIDLVRSGAQQYFATWE